MTSIKYKRETVTNIIGVSVDQWSDTQVEDEYFKLMEDPDNL